MSSKTQELSSFLKRYLKSKKNEKGAMSLEDYQRLNPNGRKIDYLTAVEKSYGKEARARSNYGSRADSLASLSLTDSGYASFLERNGQKEINKDLNAKYASYKNEESDILGGYLNYLEGYNKEINKLKSSVTDNLIKNNVFDRDSAYSYAIGAGLSEEDAIAISSSTYQTIRRKLINTVLDRVSKHELDKSTAKAYALSLGLDEKDASLIEEYAGKFEVEEPDANDELLDYLREIANKKYNK